MKVAGSALMAALLFTLAPVVSEAQESPSIDLSQPISADEAVRLALDRNYSIRLAEDRLAIQRGNRLEAYGGLVPSVVGGWNYTHSRNSGTVFDLPGLGDLEFPEQRADERAYFISVDHTLISIPTLLRIAAEKRATGAAEAEVRDAEHLAALGVREQYFSLIEAIKLLDVGREDLRLASEESRRTESLFEVGSVARTDVLKGKVRVAEAQSALITAENAVNLQRARLATTLAFPANTPLNVIESLDPRPEVPDSAAAFALAVENRPDLRALQLRKRAASAQRKVAMTSRLPSITHSYNYNVSNRPGDYDIDQSPLNEDIRYLNIQSRGWNYRIGFTWRILNGLVTEANIARAGAQERLVEHQAQDLELQVQLDVKESLLAMRAAQSQILSAREGLASAEEDLKLSQERYTVGLGTILELIDAQVNVTRARTAEVQAMAALKRAEAQLDRATGRVNW